MNFLRNLVPTGSVLLKNIRWSQLAAAGEQLPVWSQPLNENNEVKRRRLLYQSRKRGMLENDLLLSHFASKYLPKMNETDLDLYDKLINTPSNDWDLYYMVTEKLETPPEFQHNVMKLLKEFVRNETKENRVRQPEIVSL